MARQLNTEKMKLTTLISAIVIGMILMLASITVDAQCENDTINPWFVDFQFEMTMECSDFVTAVMPITDDNCDEDVEIAMLEDIIPGHCPGTQTIFRLYRAYDDNGNQVVETQIIHVVDETGPVISGPIHIDLLPGMPVDSIYITAIDNCSSVTINYTDVEVSGNNIIRLYTVTDECDNATTFEQILDLPQTPPDEDEDDNDRVAICHRLGNGGWITIYVAQQAVPAHLAHGDYLGPCNEQTFPVLPMGIYLKEKNGKFKKFARMKQ
jgi:hypothetical protein